MQNSLRCWQEAGSALCNLAYLLQLVSHFIKSDLITEPKCLRCRLVLSWCSGSNDKGMSDIFQLIQDIPVFPGLSSSSTSLHYSVPSAGMLLICKGTWSNIKEIDLQTCIHEIGEILSYFIYPCLYTSVPIILNSLNSCLKLPALFQ